MGWKRTEQDRKGGGVKHRLLINQTQESIQERGPILAAAAGACWVKRMGSATDVLLRAGRVVARRRGGLLVNCGRGGHEGGAHL